MICAHLLLPKTQLSLIVTDCVLEDLVLTLQSFQAFFKVKVMLREALEVFQEVCVLLIRFAVFFLAATFNFGFSFTNGAFGAGVIFDFFTVGHYYSAER